MPKVRKSHYNVGDPAIVKKDYEDFSEGQMVTVDDPVKYGPKYKIKVHDINHHGEIPSKYLEDA